MKNNIPTLKCRILFILHIPPPVHGAAMIGKFIQNSTILNSNFDTFYINLSTSVTNKEVGKGGIIKIFIFFKKIVTISNILFFKKFDLCYMSLSTTGYGFYKDFIIVIILKLFRKKIIYHFHNKGIRTKQHKKINNLMYRFAFKGTKSILLSPLLYSDIANYVKREDVFYCPNGIPEISNQSPCEKAFRQKDNSCRLLFLSNMTVEKGVKDLLEACKILKNNNYSFKCDFVGDWANFSEEEFKDYIVKNDLSNCVFAHGRKYNEEKLEFFCSADIFVFPTFYSKECFPLVLLEAMQFNLPVVSTNEGGIADIVSDGITGIIISKNNPAELASKLSYLISNPEMISQMGNEGKKHFIEKFTLQQFEEKMSLILKRALL